MRLYRIDYIHNRFEVVSAACELYDDADEDYQCVRLLEDHPRFGRRGEVLSVCPGYRLSEQQLLTEEKQAMLRTINSSMDTIQSAKQNLAKIKHYENISRNNPRD